MRYVLALTALLTWSQSALAQEVPEPRVLPVTRGMLCDTHEQLHQLLTALELEGNQARVDGCAMFRSRSPVPVMVTPLEWYEVPKGKALVARFEFLVPTPFAPTQYAWIAFTPNPDYQPEPEGEPT